MARIWKDRIVERPRTFDVANNPDGTITLIPSPGQVIEEGTPINAANMNYIMTKLGATNETTDKQYTIHVDEEGLYLKEV